MLILFKLLWVALLYVVIIFVISGEKLTASFFNKRAEVLRLELFKIISQFLLKGKWKQERWGKKIEKIRVPLPLWNHFFFPIFLLDCVVNICRNLFHFFNSPQPFFFLMCVCGKYSKYEKYHFSFIEFRFFFFFFLLLQWAQFTSEFYAVGISDLFLSVDLCIAVVLVLVVFCFFFFVVLQEKDYNERTIWKVQGGHK